VPVTDMKNAGIIAALTALALTAPVAFLAGMQVGPQEERVRDFGPATEAPTTTGGPGLEEISFSYSVIELPCGGNVVVDKRIDAASPNLAVTKEVDKASPILFLALVVPGPEEGRGTCLWAIAVEIGILAVLIGVPPFRGVFDLEPIDPQFWPVLATFPALFLLAEEGRKAIVRGLRAPAAAASKR